jgi:anti-sigma B factor antagonist
VRPGVDARVTISVEQDLAEVRVDGNLDFFTAPLVRETVDKAMAGRAALVEIRLGSINVVDSSGLSALVYAYKLARAHDKQLVLRGEADTVAKLLRRTSLDRVIPLRPPRRPPAQTRSDDAASA